VTRRTRSILVTAAAALMVLAGCTVAHPGHPGADNGPAVDRGAPWFASIQTDINDAKADDSSPEQIEALQNAWRTGELTFEAYSAAVDRALRCVREAGFRVFEDQVSVYQGLKMRLYSVQSRPDAQEPAVEACIKRHSYYIERAYQLQPASLEARERHFAQYRDALLDCLAGAGVAVDRQMTMDEILRSVSKGMDNGVDCLQKTGFDG
jgi:hypothetical protein